MRCGGQLWKALLASSFVLLVFPAFTFAQHYKQTNLVSDIAGMAPVHDGNLQNPWGITRSPGGGPWWVSDNNSGTSTLYDGSGNIIPINGTGVVIVPPPAFNPSGTATPTGIVYNGSSTDFRLKNGNDGSAGLANTLYFSAGIQDELHGLFGTITPVDGLDGDEE